MIVKFESTYFIKKKITYRGETEIELEKFSEYEIADEDDLENSIIDEVIDSDKCIKKEDNDFLEELDYVTITNIKKIVKENGHLINPPSCCDKAPYSANYCPTCGEKIKKI